MEPKTHELKPLNGKYVIDLTAEEYLIKYEKSATGVIIVTCVPTTQASTEIKSLLNGIDSEIEDLNLQSLELLDTVANLEKQREELLLIGKMKR